MYQVKREWSFHIVHTPRCFHCFFRVIRGIAVVTILFSPLCILLREEPIKPDSGVEDAEGKVHYIHTISEMKVNAFFHI